MARRVSTLWVQIYAETRMVPPNYNNCSTIKFIGFPPQHIGLNVFGNAVHLIGLADDMVVETRLPTEHDVVLVGETGDSTFKTPDGG